MRFFLYFATKSDVYYLTIGYIFMASQLYFDAF